MLNTLVGEDDSCAFRRAWPTWRSVTLDPSSVSAAASIRVGALTTFLVKFDLASVYARLISMPAPHSAMTSAWTLIGPTVTDFDAGADVGMDFDRADSDDLHFIIV
jgi:hypothetical protein